jgi:lipopolysaccharide transport system ATP-binding protein
VKKGETLGLIGPNGSGKTTLLKMLNGIFWPDKGKISINGRVGALIEVGAGFHPMLTGRENVYINAAILGMTKEEVDEKFDDIVEFADIGDFLDTPVKFYSSGMYVKLGFAVAVHCEPDILLVDEVLAVGDVGFRSKCYNAIYNLTKNTAVIIVSHAMPQISRLCSKTIVMHHGDVKFYSNNVPKAIEEYLGLFDSAESRIMEFGDSKITNIKLSARSIDDYYEIEFGNDLTIQFDASIEHRSKELEVNVTILSHGLEVVAQCNSKYNNIGIVNLYQQTHFSVKIPNLNLNPGSYYISLSIVDAVTNDILCWHHASIKLTVSGNFFGGAPIQFIGEWNNAKS